MLSVFVRIENGVRKGINAGYQHFPPLFRNCFKDSVCVRVVESWVLLYKRVNICDMGLGLVLELTHTGIQRFDWSLRGSEIKFMTRNLEGPGLNPIRSWLMISGPRVRA